MWATGWQERANEHLPDLLALSFGELPYREFDGRAVFGSAHWKVDAIDDYARDRPAAWIDDNVGDVCMAWPRNARHRRSCAPTPRSALRRARGGPSAVGGEALAAPSQAGNPRGLERDRLGAAAGPVPTLGGRSEVR